MKKALFLFVVSILLFNQAKASHFAGGDIRYEFNGTNYTVYVTLFKLCQTNGINLASTVEVCWRSNSLSSINNRTFNLIKFDTVNINCPGTLSNCYNITNPIPGYIAAYYKDTISIPPANDWVISCVNSARIGSITNTGGGNMYLATLLDNTGAINSNPLIANIPTYYMTAGNPISVPLQVVDPEGDSIDYQFITPLDAGSTCDPPTPLTYATGGYSLATPFGTGGTCAINPTTKMLTMMAPATGNYVVAFHVIEYRNGNIVGTYIRDIMVVVLPGTTALTFPNANPGTTFNMFTCPGQSNSVTLNFNDPTITDSVYLTVLPPTISGFTFSSSTSNGLGAASTTITWTTPSGMNPATLPQFFIRIRARDNACPNASADFALVVRTRQCVADTVWPGDANGDFTVNVYDPLAIAIASGQTGPTRTGATTSWTPQYCAPWANSFITNNTNMKHADCDGNGTVNSTDLGAVTANYSLSHPKGSGSHYKTTGLPDLYFDVTGINFAAGSTVNVPIKLGSGTSPMNDVYGLATKIIIDGITPVNAPTISTATSWLGTSSNTLNFTKAKTNSALDWAFARTNQSNTSGQGTIAVLSFTIPSNVVAGTQIKLDFDDAITKLIDYKGLPLAGYNLNEATANTVAAQGVGSTLFNGMGALIVPNPSNTEAGIQLSVKSSTHVSVEVYDIVGRKVWDNKSAVTAGANYLPLPAGNFNKGVYTVKLNLESENASQVIKWVKE